jgi:hypothetical protein
MTIVKRLVKGSELTHSELDGNFTDLDDRVSTLEGSGGASISLTSLSVGSPASASGSGNLSYDNTTGVFTYTPPDLSSFATSALENVVEDTTPQLGGDLDTNGNKITFADSVNAEFGDAGDLKIFHNGTHSIVRETGTGSLYLQSDNNVILSKDTGTEIMVKGIADGAVELYHDNVKKLETTADGIITTGKILYSNMYSQLSDLPSATTYHGMFAHVHATGKAYYAHGGNWIELANQADIGGGGGGASVTVQDDAPTNPAPTQGDLWWESDVGRLKIYYSGAWVDASPSGSGGGGVTNMASLTDVDSVDTVAAGDFLLYDGSSSEYKFVAFEAEVNGLIDSRTGGSGHISTQSQYAGIITTDAADPTDTAHHVLSNTGTPSIHTASTAWYYGDVVSDPGNPTTTVVLDIDQQRFTGAVQSDNISLGSPGSFTAQAGASVDLQGTTVHFGSATIAGGNAFDPVINTHLWSGSTQPTNGYVLSWNTALLSGNGDYEWIAQGGSTWATLGDKDGANGPTDVVLGRNAVGNSIYSLSIGNAAISNTYGVAIGMETQAATYDINVGAFSGKNHVTTDHGYRVAVGAFAQQNANPGDETGVGAIAVGTLAGDANQGANAVAIGRYAGRNNQAAQSIVLNATGADLENVTPDSFVVKPIRQQAQAQALFYDPASGEVTYDAAGGGGGLANVVDDTTPQLGGDLDLNNNNITGAGDILINTNKFTVASATGNTVIAGTLNVALSSDLDATSIHNTNYQNAVALSVSAHASQSSDTFTVTGSSGSVGLSVNAAGDETLIKGNLKVQNIQEEFTTLTGATGTVTHNCDLQNIFYHTSPAADFTVNITNLTLVSNCATTVSLVISQGASPYIPTAVQIGGVAQTLNWQGGSPPSGTVNGTDVVSLSILNDAGTYVVLGQLVGFG